MTSNIIKRFNKKSLNKYSAVIFDLSGVLIDFGMHVPVLAVSRAFRNQNIHIPEKNIRENVGKIKNIILNHYVILIIVAINLNISIMII